MSGQKYPGHFCSECANCGKEPYDGNKTKRLCLAAQDRRSAHFEEFGRTPDSFWMAPESWVYVNTRFNGGCKWFSEASEAGGQQ